MSNNDTEEDAIYLPSLRPADETIYTKQGKPITLGREGGDIILSWWKNDSTKPILRESVVIPITVYNALIARVLESCPKTTPMLDFKKKPFKSMGKILYIIALSLGITYNILNPSLNEALVLLPLLLSGLFLFMSSD